MDVCYQKELRRLSDFEAEVLTALETSAARQIYSICERTKAIAADIRSKCEEQRIALQRLVGKGDIGETQVLRYSIEDIDLATAFAKTFSLEVYSHIQTQIQPFSPGHSQSLAPKSVNLYCFSPESNSIIAYHTSSKSHSRTDSTYKLKQDAVWVMLGSFLVLYTGGTVGRDTTADCAMFNTLEVKWTQRDPMATGRGQHCAIAYDGFVYVFGGYHSHKVLTDSEKYSQTTQKWTPIAPLSTPLCYVSGTELQGIIYLTGRWSCRIQQYTVETNTVSEAEVTLMDHSGAPMINIDDRILILNNDCMHVFIPGLGTLKKDVKKLGNGGLFWSPVNWVIYGRAIFMLEYGVLNVWRYDLSTGDMTIEVELTDQ